MNQNMAMQTSTSCDVLFGPNFCVNLKLVYTYKREEHVLVFEHV